MPRQHMCPVEQPAGLPLCAIVAWRAAYCSMSFSIASRLSSAQRCSASLTAAVLLAPAPWPDARGAPSSLPCPPVTPWSALLLLTPAPQAVAHDRRRGGSPAHEHHMSRCRGGAPTLPPRRKSHMKHELLPRQRRSEHNNSSGQHPHCMYVRLHGHIRIANIDCGLTNVVALMSRPPQRRATRQYGLTLGRLA
jgi:hypothetical protein